MYELCNFLCAGGALGEKHAEQNNDFRSLGQIQGVIEIFRDQKLREFALFGPVLDPDQCVPRHEVKERNIFCAVFYRTKQVLLIDLVDHKDPRWR